MNILVTGRGGAGSWSIRGEQLGRALGALVRPMASVDEIRAADLVLVVKRVPDALLANLRAAGRPWIYDIIDAYPQPDCSTWERDDARRWLAVHLAKLEPAVVIWPTAAMRADAPAAYAHGPVLHHHHRAGLAPRPAGPLRVVGYEGRQDYLEGWMPAINRACNALGLRLVINPERLTECDVVLALRGARWDGYVQRHWKSNVKLANAHAAGIPFVGLPEAGYMETQTGSEVFIRCADDLLPALRALQEVGIRELVQRRFTAAAYPVEAAARDLYRALEKL